VRIPADVDREDRVLAGLTARQAAILAVAAASLWLAFGATRRLVPPAVFAGAAVPFALAALALAVGRRDGLSLDRWLAATARHARSPRRLVTAPDGIRPPPPWITPKVAAMARPLPAPLRLPATAITPSGVISVPGGGAVAIAAASTVNFTLRTPAEQQALTAAFGRWLNSLAHPAQILIRAHRADLTAMAAAIEDTAAALPHPALERAALDHAAFLGGLTAGRGLLARQVLITVTDPAPDGAARRITAAAQALAGAGIAVTPMDASHAADALAACCDPGARPRPAGTAPPGHVITARTPAGVPWRA
jgi:hypothetical protein